MLHSGPIHHHGEMDDRVVTQIACGRNHFAAITDDGIVLTCGDGFYAQLGHGDVSGRDIFEMVPVCCFQRFKSVSCGQASTACISTTGKVNHLKMLKKCQFIIKPLQLLYMYMQVYFWGQLEVLTQERQREVQAVLTAMNECNNLERPSLCWPKVKEADGLCNFKIKELPEDLLVGEPFSIDIVERNRGVNDIKDSETVINGRNILNNARNMTLCIFWFLILIW